MMLEILGEIAPDPHWSRPLPTSQGTSYLYPIFIILGFVVAIVCACMKMWKRYKISVEPFYWFILIGVPISILGANFGSCVLGKPAGKDWSEFFTSFGTGLAVEWGVLFCFLAGCIYFPLVLKANRYRVRDEFGPKPEVRKVSLWLYMDAILPCVLIAQCLGRWGNYFNQEVYGSVVTNESLTWFLHRCLPGMYIGNAWRQPLFLWEMLLNFAGFAILYVGLEFVKIRKTGDMTASYFVWYGIIRLCLEPLRESSYKSNATMIMSYIYVGAGVAYILLNHLLIARHRDKKVFNIITLKPIEHLNSKFYPKKVEKLTQKVVNEQDPVKKQHIQDKLTVVENKWTKLSSKYQSADWYAKFGRTDQERIYFGRW